jgi:hypothetical protein
MANALPLLIVGGAALYLLSKKGTNGGTNGSKANGKTNGALPTVGCIPGQLSGEFTDKNGNRWTWAIWKRHSARELTFSREFGTFETERRDFALDTDDETLCAGIKSFFRDQGLGQ